MGTPEVQNPQEQPAYQLADVMRYAQELADHLAKNTLQSRLALEIYEYSDVSASALAARGMRLLNLFYGPPAIEFKTAVNDADSDPQRKRELVKAYFDRILTETGFQYLS